MDKWLQKARDKWHFRKYWRLETCYDIFGDDPKKIDSWWIVLFRIGHYEIGLHSWLWEEEIDGEDTIILNWGFLEILIDLTLE